MRSAEITKPPKQTSNNKNPTKIITREADLTKAEVLSGTTVELEARAATTTIAKTIKPDLTVTAQVSGVAVAINAKKPLV